MPLRYRMMEIADIPAVLAVRFSTVENAITLGELESDYGITPETMAAAMRQDVKGWVCEDADCIVGFAMGDRANGEVQVVAVLPDYENRGIGKTVLARVRDWLFAEGHDKIWLLANPDSKVRAHAFYRRLGWRATGEMRRHDEVMVLKRTAR